MWSRRCLQNFASASGVWVLPACVGLSGDESVTGKTGSPDHKLLFQLFQPCSLGKQASVIVYYRAAKNAKLVGEHFAKRAPRDASVAGFDAPHPPPDSSLGFVTLSLTFGLWEDTWSNCGVKAKRSLLKRANGPVAATKAGWDSVWSSDLLMFTSSVHSDPRAKTPPRVNAGRETTDELQHTRSVRRRRQMICVCS